MNRLLFALILIGLVLLVIAAFKSNGATRHPLLVDSAFEESTEPAPVPWRFYTLCPVSPRNVPTIDGDDA